MYHHVGNKKGLVTLSPDIFRRQMKWLANSGWKTLSGADLEYFYLGGELPRKSVMITFDDGYLDNWLEAFPVLKEFNLKAHIFLITGLIGGGPVRQYTAHEKSHRDCVKAIVEGKADSVMLRWSEVREMFKSGLVEFHSHTHNHLRIDQMDKASLIQQDLLIKDLAKSRECLEKHLGFCSRHLCWPEGYYTRDYIRTAVSQNFDFFYTTERRMNNTKNGTLRIGRISTKERESTAWLKFRLFCYVTPVFSTLLALHKGPRLT
ncbi:carbohydrate transporter [Salmonella enterica subsp. enterica serovar Caracas]|nr:carbohydrate transporter [Salmonella enterica subsp. enterica serovar Caracas]